MKKLFPLLSSLLFATITLGQNYQYQYPTDPYSAAPQAISGATQGMSAVSSSSFDKLLSYGFLEVNYRYNDFKNDTGVSNSSGIGAALNVQLFKPLYLHFGVDWLQGTDTKLKNFSMTGISAAGGIYLPIASRFHIFGELGLRYDVTSGALYDFHPDEFAVYMRPGVRFAVTEKIEIDASLYFASTENLNNSVFQLNSYFALLSVLDLGIGVDFASDINTYHGGLRLRW